MPSDFKSALEGFNPRTIFPSGPAVKLSEKLRKLATPKHVSQRWMAAEIQKLIPEAVRLEETPTQWAAAGFVIGAISMLLIVLLVTGAS